MSTPNYIPERPIQTDEELGIGQGFATVPFTTTAGGQAYVGAPVIPDPSQDEAEAAAAAARALAARDQLAAFNAANPGLAGAPGAAPPVPGGPPALALVPAAPTEPPPIAPPLAGGPPPARVRPPAPAAPAGQPGDLSLVQLATAATVPPAAGGDAVDQELAAARAASPAGAAAKPGDLAAGAGRVDQAAAEHEAALRKQGEVEQQNLAAEARAREQQAAELQRRQAIQEQARAASDQAIQAAREKAQKLPYHSFWADKSFGQRALAMLGVILGGVSWDKNNRNEAVDILNQSIARDFEKQKEEHGQLWKDVDAAMQQGQSLRANQLQEMSQFRLNQALQLDAVIAKGTALAAGAKNAVGIAALHENNARLGFERDKAIEEARRLGAAAEESARHNRAEEAIGRGHLAVARAGAKAKAAADEDERVIKLAKRAYPGGTEALKAVKARDEAEGLVEELKKNPTALAQSLSTERLASVFGGGGKPSVAVLHMIDPNATSFLGVAQDKIQKALTGKSGDMIRKSLMRLAEDERTHAQDMVDKHRAKGESALKGLAKHAPDATANYLNGIFGEPRQPAAAPALSPEDQAAIAWAKGHGSDPRAARILQLHGM